MTWNRANRAAKTTWSTLLLLDQMEEVFDKSGVLRMEDLAFWKASQSESARIHEAEGIAIQIDNVFRNFRSAEFEPGATRFQAIENMLEVLKTGSETVSDLAAVADAHYRFWRERDR